MELRQLEYFLAVADEANFTRAAQRVNISQSGVSAQVRQLERELGAELIDRSSRTATLTAAGTAALAPARAALAAAAAVRRAVDDVNGLLRGQLAVAMVTACTVTPLFDALAAFHRAHPGVEVTLSEDSSDRMIDQVRGGLVDLALIGSAGPPPSDLDALSIVSEGLVALVPRDHPLARRRRVALDEVVAHPLVCLPPGTGIRTVLDRACAARGLEPVTGLQASAPGAVVDLARRGLGVAVLSESMTVPMILEHGDDLARVPIIGIDIPAVLALVWKPGANPALHGLLDHCRAAFAAPRPA
ncbi:MAG TPA: LysR family transcriptional regulator [Acidimicrobiales bacterium]|nr:LysR family transcriptional regulator [Acidimicrobiales bacterium]